MQSLDFFGKLYCLIYLTETCLLGVVFSTGTKNLPNMHKGNQQPSQTNRISNNCTKTEESTEDLDCVSMLQMSRTLPLSGFVGEM